MMPLRMPLASGEYFLSAATALRGAVLLTSDHRKARPPWEFAHTWADHYSDLGRIGDIVNIDIIDGAAYLQAGSDGRECTQPSDISAKLTLFDVIAVAAFSD